ncbi:MAG: hypothetical protein A2Y78_01025 [Acidobacteria bacterium RBG_13_68_16]|jgi:hypothetical protein|nr:MAG: hypothetical protein A2Y78_01025 [Acidobacteria bacterium RBG_13_68_16]
MRIQALLRTPASVHAFAAGENQLVYGRLNRRRDAILRVEHAALPPEWFSLGPVGLLQVDRHALAGGLAALIQRLEKAPQQASLVAPNSWVRSVVVDAGALPRKRQEAEEVLRWRLKKLLPCRPEDVRLDFVSGSESGRVLVILALDRPLAVVEETFSAAGVQLGRIEPAVLALTALLPAASTPVMLAAIEERALDLVVLAAGKPVLVRHKQLPADAARAEAFIGRELSRTLAHAREQDKLGGPVMVWLAAARPGETAGSVERWAAAENGLVVRRLGVGAGRVPEFTAIPDVRLWSLLGTAWGGEA